MSLKSRLSLVALAILLVATPGLTGRAIAGDFYVGADGFIGSASQSFDYAIGNDEFTRQFDNIRALRGSVSCGYHSDSGISGALEVALSERGGGFVTSTGYPERDQVVRTERTYFDIAAPLSFRIHPGRFFAGAGISPRMSFLLNVKSGAVLERPTPDDFILGADPFAFVGYRVLRLSARYLHDFGPSFSTGVMPADMNPHPFRGSDREFFLGLGVELPIPKPN